MRWLLGHLVYLLLLIAYAIRLLIVPVRLAWRVASPPVSGIDCGRESAPSARVRSRWLWLPVPMLVLLVLSVHSWHWPLLCRFALSRAEFERVVQSPEPTVHQNERLGLYRLHWVHREDRVWIFCTGVNFADPVGFLYDPTRRDAGRGTGRAVAPGWYTYEG